MPCDGEAMKHLLPATLAALCFAALPSCVIDASGGGPSYDPISSGPQSSWDNTKQEAYRDGYRWGKIDAQAAQPSNFQSHNSKYNSLTKESFGEGYRDAYLNYSRHNSHPQGQGALSAVVVPGQVRIMRAGRVVTLIQTAMPNIEAHHFTRGQQQIVVKSRGNHGPATVQLFDTPSGAVKGQVMAYAIQNGQPAWARGMQD